MYFSLSFPSCHLCHQRLSPASGSGSCPDRRRQWVGGQGVHYVRRTWNMSDEAQLASPSRINIFNPVFFVVGSRAGKDQCVTRSIFQFSRREREFLSFNLMFKTGTRISFPQYHTLRREREFHFSISGFEKRSRIEIETIFARIFGNYIYCWFIDWYFPKKKAVNLS